MNDLDDQALADRIMSDDAFARLYLELARDEALLAELVRASRARRALAPETRSRWAVAAALLVAAVTLVLAPPPGPATSPTFPPGTGLRAEYFDRPDLTQRRAVRIDSFLDFSWGDGTPDVAVAAGTWSARWTGAIKVRTAGAYTFHVLSDDGCRLWIGERLVLDRWKDQGRTEHAGPATLPAGEAVAIRLEYFNNAGPGALRLSWSGPGVAKEVVPSDVLFPAPAGGVGLRGEYFDSLDASVPRFERIDPQVHFEWGLGGPGAVDDFRVRWTGSVAPRRREPTTFTVVSDDGCRLRIDGRLVIDDWTVRGTGERSVILELDGGRRHALRLEYFDRVSTARVSLYWESPDQPRELIPQDRLYPE